MDNFPNLPRFDDRFELVRRGKDPNHNRPTDSTIATSPKSAKRKSTRAWPIGLALIGCGVVLWNACGPPGDGLLEYLRTIAGTQILLGACLIVVRFLERTIGCLLWSAITLLVIVLFTFLFPMLVGFIAFAFRRLLS
jgi:hypothetical protein